MPPAGTSLLPARADRAEGGVPALVSALAEAYKDVRAASEAYALHLHRLRRIRRGMQRIESLMNGERRAYQRRRLAIREAMEPHAAEARQAWERWVRAREALRQALRAYRDQRDHVAGLVRFLGLPFSTAVDLTAAVSGIPRFIVMRMFADPRGVRLMPDERQEIVARLQAGETASSLAEEFGVGRIIVHLVRARAKFFGTDCGETDGTSSEAGDVPSSAALPPSGWPAEVVSRLRSLGDAWTALRKASMEAAVARYASREAHRAAALQDFRMNIARSSHNVMMGNLMTARYRLKERAKALERALPDVAARLHGAVRSYAEIRERLTEAVGAMDPPGREEAVRALQEALGVTREVAQWVVGMVERYRRMPEERVDEIRRMLARGYPHAAAAVLAHVSERTSKRIASAV